VLDAAYQLHPERFVQLSCGTTGLLALLPAALRAFLTMSP